jgi:hypothetical protein
MDVLTALSTSGVPPAALAAATTALLVVLPLALALCAPGGAGGGNRAPPAQFLFSAFVRAGRARNLLCSACDRARARYPLANTCQVPFFASLSDVYTFVFGYKADGLFLEVGAYDGESFSNTSGLADMGWSGHYVEPVAKFADAARARHAGNAPRVAVHTVAISERDGKVISLSNAGPFSSAVDDEIATVSRSGLNAALAALGWAHKDGEERVRVKSVTLDTFCKQRGFAPGQVDVMVRRGDSVGRAGGAAGGRGRREALAGRAGRADRPRRGAAR